MAFTKNATFSIGASGEDFSEHFSFNAKYAPGGGINLFLPIEREVGTDELVLDTRELLGDIPPRDDQYSILWIFKNMSTVALQVQLKRPNDTGTYTNDFKLYPGEAIIQDRGRTNSSGYSWKFTLSPQDGRAYADLTDDEKQNAVLHAVAFAIDYDTIR